MISLVSNIRNRLAGPSRPGSIMNRARSTVRSISMRFHVAMANTWRDNYNPLRGLDIRRAVSLLEEGERGAFAQLQWTYRFIEMQDATLGSLIERRTSAVQKMGWDIKIREGIEEGSAEAALADKQREALKKHYEGVGNLKAAIEHLALATFRGFSILEKVEGQDGLEELAPVDQWHWVRDGLYGEWRYNEKSAFGTNKGEEIEDFEERFIVREVSRPINRVALVCFLRKNLSQKDWDGYVETYGIPAIFIVMPPNVPKGKEDEYNQAAEDVASDARGTLPNGSEVKTVDAGDRAGNPFKEHIAYQDEQLVLRGTGGKLTMLNEATGIGGSQGDVHQNAFDEIAEAEADEISECLQEQIDRAFLEQHFPGQEHYAYFAIAANEETDSSQVVEDVAALAKAGYHVADDQVEEKTGYVLRKREEISPNGSQDTPNDKGRVGEDDDHDGAARDGEPIDTARRGVSEEQTVKNARRVLHAILNAWDESKYARHPQGSSEGGRFAPKTGVAMVSPNIGEDMTLAEAVRESEGQRHVDVLSFARSVDDELGLTGDHRTAFGDWADGAENSIYSEFHGLQDEDELRYAAAIRGLQADQKAVVAFTAAEGGPDSMYVIRETNLTLTEARDVLDKHGIENRTLIPNKGGNSTAVALFDPKNTLTSNVEDLANEGFRIERIQGHGTFLGDPSWESRPRAREEYRRIVTEYEARWPDRRHYSGSLQGRLRRADDTGRAAEEADVRNRAASTRSEDALSFDASARGLIDNARAEDLQALGGVLAEALQADPTRRAELLTELSNGLPEYLASPGQEEAWLNTLLTAYLNGVDPEFGTAKNANGRENSEEGGVA